MKQLRPGTVTTGPHHESRAKASQFHTHGRVWHGSTGMSRHIASPAYRGRTLGHRPKGNKPEGTGVGSGQNGAKARSTRALAILPTSAHRQRRTPKAYPHEHFQFVNFPHGPRPNGGAGRDARVGGSAPMSPPSLPKQPVRRPDDPGGRAAPQGRPDWSNRCAKR